MPRGWRAPGSLEDMRCSEVNAVDAWLWTLCPTPRLPRVVARHLVGYGGQFAILRDVSASMDGPHATWAGAVVTNLVNMCRKRCLAVGYLEFNHEPIPLRVGNDGSFFTQDYERVLKAARQTWGEGGTNVQ